MQFVDRALVRVLPRVSDVGGGLTGIALKFPGEADHVRPTKAMPNKWERVTLGVMLSSIIHKQYEWSKRLVCFSLTCAQISIC